MHLIGIDLAWGERKPTGVAVLDEAAHLLHVCAAQTDDDIEAALEGFIDGPCLVGIDAPIVVTNATGSRPAEQALGRDFRRYEAGAHPANTGKPEFADGTRAMRLCQRWDLDHDPASDATRRAVEVYPHAATVAFFDLPRTLKYKNKPGRDIELLRGELLTLMGLVETVVVVEEMWRSLRRQVETATRKSQLRVVEDQVDAVVCAYVALFAVRHPGQVVVYGDHGTGAITTPALGSSQVVRREGDDARSRAGSDPVAGTRVREAVQTYAERQPALVQVGRGFTDLVTDVLDEAGINYLSVTGRTKSVTSFAEKASRTLDGRPLYPDPLRDITDQVGVRVIAYVSSDVDAVADLLGAQLHVTEDRDLGEETAAAGRFGYASRHLLVEVDRGGDEASARPAGESGRWAHLRGWTASVQLRTALQHAWAEFEHEARYKGTVPVEHAGDLDRRFTLAAGLLELADQEFEAIRRRLRPTSPSDGAGLDVATGSADADHDDPRLDPRELAAFLAGQYDDAGWSRTDHYAWISGLLLELGIVGLDELAEVLRRPAVADLNARLEYRYPPGAVRRLDDALLAAFGDRYVGLTGNAHRVDGLRNRLARTRAVIETDD